MGLISMHRDKQSCQEVGGISPCLFRAQMMGVCLVLFFWKVAQRRLAGGGQPAGVEGYPSWTGSPTHPT